MLERVRECMTRALKLDAAGTAGITADTTAADVPGWTSVAHLALVLELEQCFGVRFDNSEIAALGSVPAIIAKLQARLSS